MSNELTQENNQESIVSTSLINTLPKELLDNVLIMIGQKRYVPLKIKVGIVEYKLTKDEFYFKLTKNRYTPASFVRVWDMPESELYFKVQNKRDMVKYIIKSILNYIQYYDNDILYISTIKFIYGADVELIRLKISNRDIYSKNDINFNILDRIINTYLDILGIVMVEYK